jgi:hypothetical protein
MGQGVIAPRDTCGSNRSKSPSAVPMPYLMADRLKKH